MSSTGSRATSRPPAAAGAVDVEHGLVVVGRRRRGRRLRFSGAGSGTSRPRRSGTARAPASTPGRQPRRQARRSRRRRVLVGGGDTAMSAPAGLLRRRLHGLLRRSCRACPSRRGRWRRQRGTPLSAWRASPASASFFFFFFFSLAARLDRRCDRPRRRRSPRLAGSTCCRGSTASERRSRLSKRVFLLSTSAGACRFRISCPGCHVFFGARARRAPARAGKSRIARNGVRVGRG